MSNTSENQTVKKSSSKAWMIVAIVAIILLAGSGVGNYILYKRSQNFETKYNDAKSTIKDLAGKNSKMQDQLDELSGANENLDLNLDEAHKTIEVNQILVERLNKENRNLKRVRDQLLEINEISTQMRSANEQLKKMQERVFNTIDSTKRANAALKNKLKK